MSNPQLRWQPEPIRAAFAASPEELAWYAIQIRGRFEKMVARQLENKGIEAFVPLITQVHRWSDRNQRIGVPLFPGYGFVRVPAIPQVRLQVIQTTGVFGFVAANGKAIPVPDKQVDDVRLLLSQNAPFTPHAFLQVGQRVRVRGGCFDGVEGILVKRNTDTSLVVSIAAIQRSLAIHIEGYDVRAL